MIRRIVIGLTNFLKVFNKACEEYIKEKKMKERENE